MQVLIAGGAGFIGSNLAKRLLNENNDVVILDNLYTGNLKNIENLPQDNLSFEKCDITDVNLLKQIVAKYQHFDVIFNLACPASPVAYQADPIHTLETSVIGMKNLLDIATEQNSVILFSSTSEVYGEPAVHPQPETYRGNVNPDGIRACYDEGKRCAETLCFDYNRLFGTKIKVIRIFNTYGPNMDPNDGRVVSNFIIQALKGEQITIYGDGKQTRSFCYVDDLVEGIMRMIKTPNNATGPVNLGNPGEFTMLELAEMVLLKTNSKSQLTYKPLPSDDPTRRRADISLANQLLDGWAPTIALSKGIDKTIEYYQGILGI